MPKVTTNIEPMVEKPKKAAATSQKTTSQKKSTTKKKAPKKEAAVLIVPVCDEECNLRAKWKVVSCDDPDEDYRYTCNQHLGKVCEQIVKTSKVKYNILYLKGTFGG
jgi:hypothetical protein